jgi:hypothetical protein
VHEVSFPLTRITHSITPEGKFVPRSRYSIYGTEIDSGHPHLPSR